MDWQQMTSLGLVIIAAAFLILTLIRRRTSTPCSQGCACPPDTPPAHQGSPTAPSPTA